MVSASALRTQLHILPAYPLAYASALHETLHIARATVPVPVVTGSEPVLSLDVRHLSDLLTVVDDLTPTEVHWTDPQYDVGLATVTVQNDLLPESLTNDAIVVASLDGVPAVSWVVDEVKTVLVAKAEESAEVTTAGCAMLRSLMDRIKIRPTLGFDAKGHSLRPFADTRTFSFASPEYAPSGWVTPSVMVPTIIFPSYGYTGMPAGFWGLGEPWLGTSTGGMGLPGTDPAESTDHLGYLYGRYEFTLPRDMDVAFAVACDDRGDFFIDGLLLIEVAPATDPTSGYSQASVATVRLSEGSHVFAWKVVNDFGHDDPGFGAGPFLDGNPMAYAFTAWEIEGARLIGRLFGTADWADMLQLEFPNSAPGMSIHQVASIILAEGQAEGKLTDVVLDGTDELDSNGVAWDLYEYISVEVGWSLLHALQEWTQTYCEWDLPGPTDLTMYMWRWRERSQTPGVEYSTALGNLESLERLTQAIVADDIMSRWSHGWILVPPVGGTRSGTLSLRAAQSLTEATVLTAQQVAVEGATQTTYAADIAPTGAGDVPYLDYKLSDFVVVGPITERVIEFSGDLVADTLELRARFKDRYFDSSDRLVNAISRLTQGTKGSSGLPDSPVGPNVSIASYSRTSSLTWNPSPPTIGESPEITPTNSGNLFEVKVTPSPAGVATFADTLFRLWVSDDNGATWTDVLIDPDSGSAGILPPGDQPASTIIPIPDPVSGGLYATRWLWGGLTHMKFEITALDPALTGLVFETVTV